MDPVRDNFLRSLSNYSECIRPYLRQVQEKYVAAYYQTENNEVDLNTYCVREREAVTAAKASVQQNFNMWLSS
jgi:hypothetical protein